MNVTGFLRLVFPAVFAVMVSGAGPDTAAAQARLELTADNVASVVNPLMAEWIGKHKGPGAVVVVATRDATLFAKGYGLSDIAAEKPFTADATLVRPGSISKLFTGIAVMQLVDAGKLDLDRDVNGYIDFAIPTPPDGAPVTLRRLLTHRAGFEEHFKGLFSRGGEPEPLGRWLANGLPQRLFPKGDVEAYSNYGFALAGYIVERASGEAFATYIQRHILDPLGMRHSTFRQPLPDDLKPMLAKGYRSSDKPPLAFFETIVAPAGGLSATGADMGRFLRALMNGGELDGVRILPKTRLDEMMAPANATPAGYLGLVFIGSKVADRDAIGHDGETTTFFSNLRIFRERGIGVFVSRDGNGEITAAQQIPQPAAAIARRFLPRAIPDAIDARAASFPDNADIAGNYQSSRRAESTLVRLNALFSEFVVKVDRAGNARVFSAAWPFDEGAALKRIERDLYLTPGNARIAFVNDGPESHFARPAIYLQRVPWTADARWIVPAFVVSAAVVLLTLLAWPIAAFRRKRKWSEDRGDRRSFLAVRLVMLVDAAVIGAAVTLFTMRSDYAIFGDALDPWLLVFYALAWLGVFGAVLTLWAAISFWRNGTGSRWSRIHHSLVAASCAMIAWFFLTFHIAGTTLNY